MDLATNVTFITAPKLLADSARVESLVTLERAATVLLTLLLVWRVWRFTIYPLLYPDRPKELPYWIPCMYFQDNLR